MKKLLKLSLAIALSLGLVACVDKEVSDNKDFNNYLDRLPEVLLGNTTTMINQLFDDPTAYGIDVEEYTLDYFSEKDYQDGLKDLKAIKKKLKSFDYDTLSKNQQISYDVIMDYINQEEDSDDFYYLNTNYFDLNSGVQSSLPLELWIYSFKNKTALDSYVSIMRSTPEMFAKYVDFEKQRQAKGYGMSRTYLDDVLEDLQTFNTNDHSYIVTSANEKIDALTFLKEEEKETYKAAISDAYENYFLPAFVSVQQELSLIQPTVNEDAALCDYENGKAYYEYLIKKNTGFDSIKEYEQFLEEQESIIYKNVFKMADQLQEMDEDNLTSIHYTDIDNIADLLAYLETEVNNGDAFPKLHSLNYQMEVVPEALRTIFQASAAYYLSAYDNQNAQEQMILNGEYSQDDYNTIAHEGFPGHMYQHNYFKKVNHHVIRDILSNLGYVEGWATYAASQACAYAEDENGCELMELNNDIVYLYILRLDKMIHYDGISREEAYTYLKDNFAVTEEAKLSKQYEQLLENPAIFATYYGGKYQIVNLQNDAKDAWGDDYSDKRFNKAILKFGPMPFNLLKKYMQKEFD